MLQTLAHHKFGNIKLGRVKPAIPGLKNPNILKLAKYIQDLPKAPTATERGKYVKDWGMMLNDQLGDCTCAAYGHLIMAWSSMCKKLITPSDNDVLKLYEGSCGYRPGKPNTDNGGVETDVLDYCKQIGLAGDKILAYVAVNPKNFNEVKLAAYMFGGVYLGVSLPVTAQEQTVWKTVTTSGDGAPGSWGGHAVPIIAYSPKTLTCITWGQRLMMTWDFFQNYCDEAYALLSPDWILNGKCPAGFDLATLQLDLEKLAA